jgi:UDP:flavonoid glycosyltransferase YjiC (YdhE family)
VCNGGSPTCQQALANGVPVIGIASNLDQYLNMDYIERFGAGKLIRSDLVRSDALRDATLRAIDDPGLRERARRVAALVKATRPESEFPSAIRSLLDAMPQTTEKLPT